MYNNYYIFDNSSVLQEELQSERRRRNLLVLIHNHLEEQGYIVIIVIRNLISRVSCRIFCSGGERIDHAKHIACGGGGVSMGLLSKEI